VRFLIQLFDLLFVFLFNHAAFQLKCGSDLSAGDCEFV